MDRDGFVVPVESQASRMKKTAVSTSWVLLDQSGKGTILDVDKYAIMRRVHIHARDLRILDPLLSYPSTILGREKVIVLNLEVNFFFQFLVLGKFFSFSFGFNSGLFFYNNFIFFLVIGFQHIKAIITAEEVILYRTNCPFILYRIVLLDTVT